ncbi:F-box only protein 39-like [Parambassis ranga]|uniref:F-box only protein 39-like n=1 Tax=Parambassis ranga TaxID=210632 RepID=A0A6P7JDR0_9TELE|nr:F-box only protein 39 [Parambassis ranga]
MEERSLSVESDDSGSETMSGWMLLPHVCLQHVFRFLSNVDRVSAALVCHHWHKVMRSASLWRTYCIHFNGPFPKFNYAVGYIRHLGAHLHRLDVSVCPPQRSIVARRISHSIIRLFSELIRVNPTLHSLTLVRLELDRHAWTSKQRNSLVGCLIDFLHRSSSKLTFVSLNSMHNNMTQGLPTLQALLNADRRSYPQCYISSLDLVNFFSPTVIVHRNPTVAHILGKLRGLTNLTLSYSCLSDELLIALQQRHTEQSQTSSRNGITLQTLTLHCYENEPHQQVVCGDLWASLASTCPDLRVKFRVNHVTNTDELIRMLQPGIPMAEYVTSAYCFVEDDWSAKPLLRDLLPQYRYTLQRLNLHLYNRHESLDEELLLLVKKCECLEQLRLSAFLDIQTVEELLHIRMTLRTSLNYIRVRIYTSDTNTRDREEQLEQILNSHPHLPHELKFFTSFCGH